MLEKRSFLILTTNGSAGPGVHSPFTRRLRAVNCGTPVRDSEPEHASVSDAGRMNQLERWRSRSPGKPGWI